MKKIASRKDPRIIDLLISFGPAGYGIYVMLVEYLGNKKAMRSRKDISRIAYELHTDAETVRAVLEDFNLFDCTETDYYNLGKAPAPEVAPTPETPKIPETPAAPKPDDIPSKKNHKRHRHHPHLTSELSTPAFKKQKDTTDESLFDKILAIGI